MKKICLNCGEWFNSKNKEKLCDRCSKLGTVERGSQSALKKYYDMHKGDKFFKYLFLTLTIITISAIIYGIGKGLI